MRAPATSSLPTAGGSRIFSSDQIGAKLPTIAAIAVVVVGLVQLADGAVSIGVSTDEPTHVERTYGWISTGWYVPGPYLIDGFPDPHNELATPFVYGPAYSSLAHLINVEVGNEPIGNVSFATDAYTVRHLVVAALAALTAAVAGAVVWLLTGSWRFGLWTAAALLAIPAWMGHGFFNPKDVPAATGYTLATAGLVFALAPGPASRRRLLGAAALLAAGAYIGVGTRLALWAAIFASLLAYAALRAGQRWRGRIEGGWRRDAAVLAGVALGALAIALLYPKAAETPRTLLTHSVSASADYPNESATLTAGQLLPEHPPWWYLPTWIGAQLPLLIGALAVLGAVLALLVLSGSRKRGPGSVWRSRRLGLLLVLQQAVLLPLLAIAGSTTMYDAARQHLYVLPALAILAGVGAERAWRWASSGKRSRAWPAIAAFALVAALLMPMGEQLLLFPYDYTYVNAIAGIGGVNGRWETDYWHLSNREALSRVPRGVRLLCSSSLLHTTEPKARPKFNECGHQPFDDERGSAATRGAPDQKIWVISFPRGDNVPPPWCEDADDVTRWLRGEEVVMAYVLRCDPQRVRAAGVS